MSERKMYYGKEEVKALQSYDDPRLTGQEKDDLRELKAFLGKQNYTVLCSKFGFNHFVEDTIKTGNVGLFKYQLQKFAKNWPRKAYHLTDSGNLNVVTLMK